MRTVRLGHSPDPDDAFMFYALAKGLIATGDLRFEHILEDIESLNRRALGGELEVTALSVHAYAHVADRYALLRCGASMGEGYGPLVVAAGPMAAGDLKRCRVAVPGTMTTAFLLLRMALGHFEHVVVPFDRVMTAVAAGEADAGLIIHEGQLTYGQRSLCKVLDLGEWWLERTGLPLPLGVNGVRKDLGDATMRQVARAVRESIEYGLRRRDDALKYALGFARDMDERLADRFVGMYVNDYTVDMGERGREAIAVLLGQAFEAGLVEKPVEPEIVDG